MSQKTNIAWTDVTWNPVTGCNKVSAGCKHCYAEVMAKRLQAMNTTNMARGHKSNGYENGFKVTLRPDRLNEPYLIKKPSMFFVCSMADLFHKDVPLEYVDEILQVMRENKQHIFQILTKRADRLAEYSGIETMPRNAWVGVTVENKKEGLQRIDYLKKVVTAKVKFLSCEPLLEDLGELDLTGIDWVIVGGENGNKARPMHPDWVRNIQRQCQEQGVAFFFKQWGEWKPSCQMLDNEELNYVRKHGFVALGNNKISYKVGKKAAGNLLDGQVWQQMPEVKL